MNSLPTVAIFALVLKNQNPFLNADFTKFFLKRLLNRQNGTFSIDLWNGFTENREAIASRVWLDCYYVMGVGAC